MMDNILFFSIKFNFVLENLYILTFSHAFDFHQEAN